MAIERVASRTGLIGSVAAGVVVLAGCEESPAAPTTVVVNTPSDGGPVVLLTVMVGLAFLALIAAGVAAWGWAQQRRAYLDAERARREAEDTVLALTGQPIDRVRLGLLRGSVTGVPVWPVEEPDTPRRRRPAIEGWAE